MKASIARGAEKPNRSDRQLTIVGVKTVAYKSHPSGEVIDCNIETQKQRTAIMPTHSDSPMSNAGERLKVRIIGGTYVKAFAAWLNPTRGKEGYTNSYIYLFVKLKERSEPKAVRIKKENAVLVSSIPTVCNTYEEAVLDQHHTIRKKMNDLVKLLARCDLQDNSNMGEIFVTMLDDAQTKLADNGDDMIGRIITTWREG